MPKTSLLGWGARPPQEKECVLTIRVYRRRGMPYGEFLAVSDDSTGTCDAEGHNVLDAVGGLLGIMLDSFLLQLKEPVETQAACAEQAAFERVFDPHVPEH